MIGEINDAIDSTGKRDAVIKLSPCERQVLMLFLAHGRLQPVAGALGRSVHTICQQHAAAMRKLGVRNPVELTLRAIQKGLVKR